MEGADDVAHVRRRGRAGGAPSRVAVEERVATTIGGVLNVEAGRVGIAHHRMECDCLLVGDAHPTWLKGDRQGLSRGDGHQVVRALVAREFRRFVSAVLRIGIDFLANCFDTDSLRRVRIPPFYGPTLPSRIIARGSDEAVKKQIFIDSKMPPR
jgi:hypothetical protein